MARPAARAIRWLAGLLPVLAVAAGISIYLDRRPPKSVDAYSRREFDRWLAADPARSKQFTEFERYLADREVSRVMPTWQLLRTDSTGNRRCMRPAFLMPPRQHWGNVVPVLRLLRESVVPLVGAVEVVSSYRTEDFNECVGGAKLGRHLSFSAVDLVAKGVPDKREMFRRLCRLRAELGPGSRFGLGAYFDPDAKGASNSGRFHVDVSGYRSWGYSKHAGSGCRRFPNLSRRV